MSTSGQVTASLRTDQGRVRDHNEDFIAYREPAGPGEEATHGWLYIVADGVGGAEAGEIASQYATERTIHHYLSNQETRNWGQRLRQAMQAANSDLRRLVSEKEASSRMATTMVAAVIHDNSATVANVGDSRGYYWLGGALRQITKDQSLVARLLEEGAITEEEAVNHPRKNVILHSLGSETTPQIDLYEVPLSPGTQLVLCSDGLTRHVTDEEIATVVGEASPAEATEQLIQLANERGGEDNISVAVVCIGEQATQSDQVKTVLSRPAGPTRKSRSGARRALWIYTAILCLVQAVLIVLIWLFISAA
ncbi:MAG: Stp1/IreP family PP2C-type Ser/Thr phosphatase [Chloroflexi bacterium]|nr:Stp1/IreP family PP2C-type Ser/Thr phosphatase [Chloroflexota bacterium]MCI0579393.1 Stp1/IreP family PP2C-type Ser/Thr phosphatase [Chloroflexota bacterium]MCI0643781.1 Stp1/IreP family PP2C-type Ser/Thr phosphatase [Chloroflexota bacterium]MCI0730031.1 Stp1/IreP family PP2C-type Ser/Thr phosphatase [Chloroflexota bacterium]